MTALGTIVAASPLNANDASRYTGFTIDLNGTETTTFALGNMPANFDTMNTVSWTYDGRENINGGDDSETVRVCIRNAAGTVVLAGASATYGSRFQQVYTKPSGSFSTTDVTRGPTAFTYVNQTATKTDWDNAVVEFERVNSKNKGADGVRPEIDYFAITGDYDAVSTPSPQQTNFRVRTEDTVALNSTTFAAALNTNPSAINVGTGDVTIRLRFEIDEVNSFDLTDGYQLRVSKNSGAYNVPASVAGVTSVNSSQYTDGAATTNVLSGSGRTFQAGEGVGSDNVTGTITALNNEHTELEFCVRLDSASLANNDTLDFRVYLDDGTALSGGYTNTPRITVTKPTAAYDLDSFRWYNDGSESGSTARAATNTWPPPLVADTAYQLRNLIQETGGAATAQTFGLEYRAWIQVGGGDPVWSSWRAVGGPTSGELVRMSDSGSLTDGAATTQRIGAGSFTAGKCVVTDATADSVTIAANGESEFVWQIEVNSAATTPTGLSFFDRSSFEFRVVTAAATPVDTTTNTPIASPVLELTNGFETGLADGTAITTTNSDDNGAGDAFDFVQGTPAPEYDTAVAHEGTRSARLQPAVANVNWDDIGQKQQMYTRFYLYLPSGQPTATARFFEADDAPGTAGFQFNINTSRQIVVQDQTQTLATFTTALTSAGWSRVEVFGDVDGNWEVRIFVGSNVDGTTPDETQSGTNLETLTEFDQIFYRTTADMEINYDALALGNVDWFGPVGGGAFDETGRQVTITSTVTSTDVLSGVEDRAVTITSTVTSTDVQTYVENRAETVTSTITSTDVQHYVETLAFGIGSTITSTDARKLNETGRQVDIISTVTSTDVLHAVETLAETITSTVTSTDVQHYVDALAETIAATIASTDVQTWLELDRPVVITATLAVTDQLQAIDDLAFTITSTITSTDNLQTPGSYDETGRQVSITATISSTDTLNSPQTFDETGRTVVITSTLTSTDVQSYVDALAVAIASTLASTDVQSYVDALTETITATITSTDALTFDETGRTVTITSTVSSTDNLIPVGSFDETGRQVVITSTVAGTDAQTYVENVTVDIGSAVTSTDLLSGIENLSFTIASTVSSTDVLSGPQTFDETGRTLSIASTVSCTDLLSGVENVTVDIAALTSSTDAQHYVEPTLLIEITATVRVLVLLVMNSSGGSSTDAGRFGRTTDAGRFGRTTDGGKVGSTSATGLQGYTD